MKLKREINWCEPFDLAGRLAHRPGFAFLDSALRHPELGRYSFIGIEPFGSFTYKFGRATWNNIDLPEPPLEALRRLLAQFVFETDPSLPPFQGGAIGAVPYEFGWELEGLRSPAHRGNGTLDPLHFSFYDLVFAFDLLERRVFIVSSGFPEIDPERRPERAMARLDYALSLVEAAPANPSARQTAVQGFESNFTQAGYHAAIERVRTHIFDGDIYQANIAQRFVAAPPADFSPFAFYGQLRSANPAPYAGFLRCGNATIASSSPELLLRKRGTRVEARPIKGTIARAAGEAEDAEARRSLLASEKDRAENIMIVDLLRNDLSRVCRPFSVDVPIVCGLETYGNVHHLVSVIKGELTDEKDCLDLLAAAFPGGSVTGAPKRRAMEIIEAVEGVPRGYYCGSIGFIGFDGTMDLNIAIRTAILRQDEPMGEASFHAGGGITCLSDPQAEYEETHAKVKRIFAAFQDHEPQ